MQKKEILIIGNWKMNPQTTLRAKALFLELKKIKLKSSIKIVICPPFVYLSALANVRRGGRIGIGAQNVAREKEGAHTGEVSAPMLASVGVTHVIVGHSERRAMGETNDEIGDKVLSLLKSKLTPVLCVGERDRDGSHLYLGTVKAQLDIGLSHVPQAQIKNIVIAYEPVWAIGKDATRVATPEESREMAIFIRKVIADKFGAREAQAVRIIYGGSVDAENGPHFLAEGGVQGLLPGRLSLEPKKFAKLLQSI